MTEQEHNSNEESQVTPQEPHVETISSNADATVDLAGTVELLKGGLLEPAKTWDGYLDSQPSWKKTAFTLAGPLVILSAVLTPIFSRIFGSGGSFFKEIIFGLIGGAIGLALLSFLFNFFSKTFKGTDNFARSFAAVSLASVPGFLGGIAGSLIPWLGWILSLAGGILSLVFLYKIMPKALNIPEDKRPLHYIASVLTALVTGIVLSMTMGISMLGASGFAGSSKSDSSFSSGKGVMGFDDRLLEEAYDDEYEPPSDGEVSKKQVKNLISNLEEVSVVRMRMEEEFKKTAEKLKKKEEKGNMGFSDLGNMMKGMKGVAGMATLEPITVKRNGDNYAEHQWVKQALQTSKYQRDVNEAAAKNFALYEKYQDELDAVLN